MKVPNVKTKVRHAASSARKKDEIVSLVSPLEAVLRALTIEVIEYAIQLETAISQANASHRLPIGVPYSRSAQFTNALAGASAVAAENTNESKGFTSDADV